MERRAERVRLWSMISWLGWGVVKRRTAVCAENRNSKYPWYFPMATGSVLLYQQWADELVVATDWVPRTRAQWSPNTVSVVLECR